MKKEYISPDMQFKLFSTTDILAGSDVVIVPGQGTGWNDSEDETEFIPFAGF